MSSAQIMSRGIQKSILSIEMEEEIGAVIHRSVDTEEVTYMMSGACQHEDFCGHRGIISAGDLQSQVYTRTQTMYLDFTMQPGSMMEQAIPPGWNAFVYILSGKALFGPKGNQTEGLSHHALVLTHELDGLQVENKSKEACQFVLIGGEPINEPVVSYGPFVMNTDQEIELAKQDYRLGRNGCENAHSWNSFIVREDEELL